MALPRVASVVVGRVRQFSLLTTGSATKIWESATEGLASNRPSTGLFVQVRGRKKKVKTPGTTLAEIEAMAAELPDEDYVDELVQEDMPPIPNFEDPGVPNWATGKEHKQPHLSEHGILYCKPEDVPENIRHCYFYYRNVAYPLGVVEAEEAYQRRVMREWDFERPLDIAHDFPFHLFEARMEDPDDIEELAKMERELFDTHLYDCIGGKENLNIISDEEFDAMDDKEKTNVLESEENFYKIKEIFSKRYVHWPKYLRERFPEQLSPCITYEDVMDMPGDDDGDDDEDTAGPMDDFSFSANVEKGEKTVSSDGNNDDDGFESVAISGNVVSSGLMSEEQANAVINRVKEWSKGVTAMQIRARLHPDRLSLRENRENREARSLPWAEHLGLVQAALMKGLPLGTNDWYRLLDNLSWNSQQDYVLKVIDLMREQSVVLDSRAYSKIVLAHLGHQQFDSITDVMAECRANGHNLDTVAYAALIGSVWQDPRFEDPLQTAMGYLRDMATEPVTLPNYKVFDNFIDIAAKSGLDMRLSSGLMKETSHVSRRYHSASAIVMALNEMQAIGNTDESFTPIIYHKALTSLSRLGCADVGVGIVKMLMDDGFMSNLVGLLQSMDDDNMHKDQLSRRLSFLLKSSSDTLKKSATGQIGKDTNKSSSDRIQQKAFDIAEDFIDFSIQSNLPLPHEAWENLISMASIGRSIGHGLEWLTRYREQHTPSMQTYEILMDIIYQKSETTVVSRLLAEIISEGQTPNDSIYKLALKCLCSPRPEVPEFEVSESSNSSDLQKEYQRRGVAEALQLIQSKPFLRQSATILAPVMKGLLDIGNVNDAWDLHKTVMALPIEIGSPDEASRLALIYIKCVEHREYDILKEAIRMEIESERVTSARLPVEFVRVRSQLNQSDAFDVVRQLREIIVHTNYQRFGGEKTFQALIGEGNRRQRGIPENDVCHDSYCYLLEECLKNDDISTFVTVYKHRKKQRDDQPNSKAWPALPDDLRDRIISKADFASAVKDIDEQKAHKI